MAPPSPRRAGFSRRAQYGIFATYVIAIFGALLALLLALTARFDPKGHAAIQSFLSDLTSPIARGGRATLDAMGDTGKSITAYFNAGSKNKELEAELKVARQKAIEGDVAKRENAQLKRIVQLKEQITTPTIIARLVSSTATSTRRFATLSAGSTSGVQDGMIVRTADGLVGTVLHTGAFSARVSLIIETDRKIPVRRSTDGTPAIATGRGDGSLDISPLVAGNNPFRVGDIFVTSGIGGLYQPNLPVVKVTALKQGVSSGWPLADPASFDFAIVEPAFVAPPPEPVVATEQAKPPVGNIP